jgi:apurinic endonuclease APN1
MRGVGLNLRLKTNLYDLINEANRLDLPFFQSFLTFQETGKYIKFTQEECKNFLLLKGEKPLYAHGSYKINLASTHYHDDGAYFLKKELELARKLECNYLIVHPGATRDCQERNLGIDYVAKKINTVFKKEYFPSLLLENTAFGSRTIGGEIYDLAHIRSKLDKPEKVQFCIDTAHAYSYGYNIADSHEQEKFIQLLHEVLGFQSIALIHLNDTKVKLGEKHDRHDILGEGNIGEQALKKFVLDPRLAHIPLMLELPILPEDMLKEIMGRINLWKHLKER